MRPTVVFVIGPAGSGKSSVGKRLAAMTGATYLDKDSVARRFVEALLVAAGDDPNARDNSEYYRQELMPLEYAALLDVARDNLRLGRPVVLDAPFVRYFGDRDYLRTVVRDHEWPADTDLVVVHVKTRGDAVQRRVATRGYDRDGWKLRHWDEFWASASAADCEWEQARHLTIDNSDEGLDQQALTELVERLHPAPGSVKTVRDPGETD